MRLDIQVYTKHISNDLIPKIISRLNDFEMVCEIDPSFSFNDQSGLMSFKFQLINPPFDKLKGKALTSGFEFFLDDFDFEEEKKDANSRQGDINELVEKTGADKPFLNPDIDNMIKDCKKLLFFVWYGGDSFELRFASLTSAIITELTNGVYCGQTGEIWYENENLVEKNWKEIQEYETKYLKETDLKFHEFERW